MYIPVWHILTAKSDCNLLFKSHQNQLFRHQFYTRVIYQFGNDKKRRKRALQNLRNEILCILWKSEFFVSKYSKLFDLCRFNFAVCVILDLLFTSIMIWIPLCLHFPSQHSIRHLTFLKVNFFLSLSCKFPQECRAASYYYSTKM